MKIIRNTLAIGVLAALILGTIIMMLPAGSVSAQAPTPPAPSDSAGKAITKLEKAYQGELKLLERQENALKQAVQTVDKIKAQIAKLKEKGIDTAKAEAALKKYEAKLAEAKTLHEKAAGILKTHAGFDANGKVTDRAKAVETVKDAGQALRQAQKTLGEGRKAIWELFKEWREKWLKNRPNKPGA